MENRPQSYFNPFPNKPLFLCVCNTFILKTLCEKEKLLMMSTFSFSHSVFATLFENFLPFSSNLKLCLRTLSVCKSIKFVIWARVKFIPIEDHPKFEPSKLGDLLILYQTTKF